MITDKVRPHHLERKALLYVRQSSAHQVLHNRESSALQYAMRDRLKELGWSEIEIIDDDLGRSAAGFERMLAEVCLGKVGAVCAREVSRFARKKKKVAKEGCRNATVTDAWSAFSGPIRSVIRSRTLATFRASRWAGGTARMRPYGDPIPFGKRLWPEPGLPMIAGQMTLKPIFYNSRSTLTICYLYAAWRSQCGLRLHVSC
jgi:hypothetical protein